MKKYDLVVIGGGPAGTPVAMEYAKLNPEKKIAIVEKKGKLGGECLFDGCIPSKIMEMSAKLIRELETLEEFGITLESKHYELTWEKIVQRKEEILSRRTKAAQTTSESLHNIEILKANASFLDEDRLEIVYDDAKKEEIIYTKCVIATGTKAFIPPYKGNALEKVWTNEDFFEKMELPKSMSIIGDGAIAIEFAQILATLGVQINLIGRREGILKNVDKAFSHIILKELQESENINLILNAQVTEINFETAFEVKYRQEKEEKTISSQRVLIATGRAANTEELKLENAGVVYDKQGIKTDKHLLTSNKNIYANGDIVIGFPKFAHTAMYGAHTIAQNLFLEHNFFSVNFKKNSWVLFSAPNIAQAGIGEDEAKRLGLDVLVGVYDYRLDAKFQIEGQKIGFLKFVVEKSSKKIIGVGAILNEANAIIGEGALIVANEITLSNLISTIHPHPTFSESFTFLAKQMMAEIMVEKLKTPIAKSLLAVERFL